LNSLLNVFLIRVMLWLLAFSCFFATLNYLFFISSFRGTPYFFSANGKIFTDIK